MPNGADPHLNKEDLANSYGWALSVLKSDPSLWKMFNQAIKHDWAPEKFVAEIRTTKWFKTTGDQARAALILQKTDPATWHAKVNEALATVRDQAAQLGSSMSDAALKKIAKNSLMFGWNSAQMRDTLAAGIKVGATSGAYTGEAAVSSARLHEMARNNGIKVSDHTVQSWVRRIGAGEQMSGFESYIRSQAATAFPAWADQLAAGADVSDLASPYVNSMATTLELNPTDIDLFDPTIRKAMQNVQPDAAGKTTIGAQPMWQFEQSLKQDKRWLKTNNAKDSLNGVGHSVLQSMGLVS